MPNINTSVRNNIYKKNYIIIMITCSEETRQETKKPMRPTENSLNQKPLIFGRLDYLLSWRCLHAFLLGFHMT